MVQTYCYMTPNTTHANSGAVNGPLTFITKKCRITVPAIIRRMLGLTQGDKVAVTLKDNEVRLRRPGNVVERTAGSLKGDEPPLSAEELRATAESAIAQAAIQRMGAQVTGPRG